MNQTFERLDRTNCYRACLSRDARFDGRFFVGVTTTNIYCRPICPARTPHLKNCQFFATAAHAETKGFRPCLRCRPELAPGLAPSEASERLAIEAAKRIEETLLVDESLADLATAFGTSDRHLRRVFQEALGVKPVQFLQSQRLLMAKRLLTDTTWTVTRVAMSSGFGSLRRFTSLFSNRYRMPATRLRKESRSGATPEYEPPVPLPFRLTYRPPYDAPSLLRFLGERALRGIEYVTGAEYHRHVRLSFRGKMITGKIAATFSADGPWVEVVMSDGLLEATPVVLGRIKRLFDLSADPEPINRVLGDIANDSPGRRVPGAFDGFEMAVRAILGQQVTVAAAQKISQRLVDNLGERDPTLGPSAVHFPDPERLASVPLNRLGELGVIRARGRAVLELSCRVSKGEIRLDGSATVEQTIRELLTIKGIGPWTADYIAIRALKWPDAFPEGDVVVQNALDLRTASEANAMAERWRPWRSYAVMHLWQTAKGRK